MTGPGSRTAGTKLPLRHALALGLLHGPTELLPISSSGHTTLVPWLARWSYTELDPQLRKSFEVALHAGTAAALLAHTPWEGPAQGQLGFFLAALGPPALCGYKLGGQIERRFGTPTTIAFGLLAGSGAMAAAEMRARKERLTRARKPALSLTPKLRELDRQTRLRAPTSIDARNGLMLGFAQSLALLPGVSRSGATFAAARALGFSRPDADKLSWRVGLPVIAGASVLKGTHLARAKPPHDQRLALAVGAGAAFGSTLASATALKPARRAKLVPASIAYRTALALIVIKRMRDNSI